MIDKIMHAIKTTLVIENKQSLDLLKSKITKVLNEEVRKDFGKENCEHEASFEINETHEYCPMCDTYLKK